MSYQDKVRQLQGQQDNLRAYHPTEEALRAQGEILKKELLLDQPASKDNSQKIKDLKEAQRVLKDSEETIQKEREKQRRAFEKIQGKNVENPFSIGKKKRKE